jgi:hypothetical protein
MHLKPIRYLTPMLVIILPVYYEMLGSRFTHHQRILVTSAFYASLSITAIAIPLSVLLSVDSISDAIFGHVKVCAITSVFISG